MNQDLTTIMIIVIVIWAFGLLYVTYIFDIQRITNDDYYDSPV